MIQGYKRVSRSNPCQVCGKPDWCLAATDGTKAICPRVPSGICAGEAGYVHSLDGLPVQQKQFQQPTVPPPIDAAAMQAKFKHDITDNEVWELSDRIGVSARSLVELGVGRPKQWLEGTYSFPMRDASCKVIGIRLRNLDGHKWAVYGSKNGLFYCPELPHIARVFICEGPTDAAALRDMDFDPIGRPSNTTGNDMLKELLARTRPNAIIVAENDGKKTCDHCTDKYCIHCEPGMCGADRCAEVIAGATKSIKIIQPLRGKDAREWINQGATRETILAVVANAKGHCGKS